MNFFDKILELINWIKIFLSPVIISLILASILFLNSENIILHIAAGIIVIAGLAIGIYLAEKIRKNHGTERFMAKIYESPDLDNIKNKI